MSSIKREEPKNDMDQVSDRLANLDTSAPDRMSQLDQDPFADSDDEDNSDFDLNEYTEEEIGCSNKSVRILPGVRRFIDSLPGGRYAVATSGAKTCAQHLLDGKSTLSTDGTHPQTATALSLARASSAPR